MCERGTTQTVVIRRSGHVCDVDSCIANLVRVLNGAGYETIASCCGHGIRPGVISLRDGRELVIARTYDEARSIDQMFEPLSRPSIDAVEISQA